MRRRFPRLALLALLAVGWGASNEEPVSNAVLLSPMGTAESNVPGSDSPANEPTAATNEAPSLPPPADFNTNHAVTRGKPGNTKAQTDAEAQREAVAKYRALVEKIYRQLEAAETSSNTVLLKGRAGAETRHLGDVGDEDLELVRGLADRLALERRLEEVGSVALFTGEPALLAERRKLLEKLRKTYEPADRKALARMARGERQGPGFTVSVGMQDMFTLIYGGPRFEAFPVLKLGAHFHAKQLFFMEPSVTAHFETGYLGLGLDLLTAFYLPPTSGMNPYLGLGVYAYQLGFPHGGLRPTFGMQFQRFFTQFTINFDFVPVNFTALGFNLGFRF